MSRLFWLMPLGLIPVLQIGFNLVNFTVNLLQGQPKPKLLIWCLLYASTIPAAMRGDLMPYIVVRSEPG